MKICIPSRSRWNRVGLVLREFPLDVRHRIILFIPESQHNMYENATTGVQVHPLPDAYRMAEVRDYIGHVMAFLKQDVFLMVDDDVRFEVRRGPDTTATRHCEPEDVRQMLDTIEQRLRDGRWGMVGIQARQFQNAAFPPGPPDRLQSECVRNMCVTGWRTEDFLKVDYTRCVVRSDFDATLQLLRRGRPNLNLGYWQHSQVNNISGGCADYRTTEIANAAAHQLAELHPGLVKVVERHYPAQARRNKNNMGDRLEVSVAWKKAFGWDLREGGASL